MVAVAGSSDTCGSGGITQHVLSVPFHSFVFHFLFTHSSLPYNTVILSLLHFYLLFLVYSFSSSVQYFFRFCRFIHLLFYRLSSLLLSLPSSLFYLIYLIFSYIISSLLSDLLFSLLFSHLPSSITSPLRLSPTFSLLSFSFSFGQF